jgi:hypothetical protein
LLQEWGMLTFALFRFQAHHFVSQPGGPGRAPPGTEGGARVDGQFRNGLLPVAAGGLDQAPGQPDYLPRTRAGGLVCIWWVLFNGLEFEVQDL